MEIYNASNITPLPPLRPLRLSLVSTRDKRTRVKGESHEQRSDQRLVIRVQVPRAGPRPLATRFTGEIEAIKTDKRLKIDARSPYVRVFVRYRFDFHNTLHGL